MSKVPLTSGSPDWAIEPTPASFRVAPRSMVVRPVKVLTPVRVSVPAAMVSFPPVPTKSPPSAMTPPKVPEALVSVRVYAPSETPPEPFSVTIEAPAAVPEISKVPASITFDELAIEPAPVSASTPAASMVVTPV